MAGKKRRMDYTVDTEARTVAATVLESGNTYKVGLGDLSDEIVTRLALHGLKQVIGDTVASPDSSADTVIPNKIENLKNGVFVSKGGGGSKGPGDLYLAMSQATGKSLDEVSVILDAMTPEQRRAIPTKYSKVKSALADIRAKRATEKAKAAKTEAKDAEDDLEALFA